MSPLLSLPRVPLAALPTPLQPADRLADAIGVEVWLKRDDLTGLGLGGNKVRALEYLVADALSQNCDCLVTGAGPHAGLPPRGTQLRQDGLGGTRGTVAGGR